MTGHQQLVNDVKFSPDARLIASASFDKSVRLWNGTNGQFMARMNFLGKLQYTTMIFEQVEMRRMRCWGAICHFITYCCVLLC